MRLVYGAQIFEEGDVYVGRCQDLDVSTFGDTSEEAKGSLKEAVSIP